VLALLTYLYLAAFLRLLGIHPHYTIPDFDLNGRRALVVCTITTGLDPSNKATGALDGSEFTVPYYAFVNAGLEVDMASPKAEIPIQPGSWSWPLGPMTTKRFMADKRPADIGR
jgi:hypothetical protein